MRCSPIHRFNFSLAIKTLEWKSLSSFRPFAKYQGFWADKPINKNLLLFAFNLGKKKYYKSFRINQKRLPVKLMAESSSLIFLVIILVFIVAIFLLRRVSINFVQLFGFLRFLFIFGFPFVVRGVCKKKKKQKVKEKDKQ